MNSTIRFIHISDTHIGNSQEARVNGGCPYSQAQILIENLKRLPFIPDFIVHTGDVVADPDPRAFTLAKTLLAEVPAPLFVVNGNHDTAAGLIEYFPIPSRRINDSQLCYSFQIRGRNFCVLDCKIEGETKPEGYVGHEQLTWLEEALREAKDSTTIFMHFPPFKLDCAWADECMLLRDGEELHALLVKYRDRLAGVFFGHIHRSVQLYRDGILYSAVGSSFCQFQLWPALSKPEFEVSLPGTFRVVTLDQRSVIIKDHCCSVA